MSTRVRELKSRGTALAAIVVIFVTAYLTLAVSSASDSFVSATEVVTWWPAVGIACTLALVTPYMWWWWILPAVVGAGTSANMLMERPADLALSLSLIVALEMVLFATVMRWRSGGLAVLATPTDFLRMMAAVALATGVGGAVGGAVLPFVVSGPSAQDYLLILAPSHAASILVLAPVLMSLGRPLLSVRVWELLIQTAGLTVSAILAFWFGDTLAMTFVPIPFLVWAAFKFGVRVVAIQLVITALLASVSTARGHGPFILSSQSPSLDPLVATTSVQVILICIVLICIPLAVNVEQSLRLTDQLRASSDLFRDNFADSLVAMMVLRAGRDGFEILDANEQSATILGLEPGDVIGRNLDDVIETKVPLALIADEMSKGGADGWRGEGMQPGLPVSQVAVSIRRLSEPSGDSIFSAQLMDLTTERVARADLESERQLSDITLATTTCLIAVCDLQGTILRANPALSDLTGIPLEDVVGKSVWGTATVADTRDMLRGLFASDRPVPRTGENLLVAKDGSEHLVAWTSGVVNNAAGDPQYVVLTGLDITAERKATGLMQHVFAAAMDTALIGVDPSGTITLFNSGAESLLGTESCQAIGSPFADLPSSQFTDSTRAMDPRPSFQTLLHRLVDQPAQDLAWRRPDGETTHVSVTMSRVTDYTGTLLGYLCIGRDVTEVRQTQLVLATALDKERQVVERLQNLDAAKDDFVSTVSHEVRTPVASIVGYTELLQDGDFGEIPPDQLPVVDAINRNAERLISLVDNLLALNGLAPDTVDWEKSLVDLVALLHAVEETTAATEMARRLKIRFETPDHPVLVEGDRDQLERALTNLLNNAMKFTDPGGRIFCTLSVHADTALIVLQDTGLGIHPEEMSNIFNRFWRGSTATSRHIQGTGLGLPIVQAIVRAHAGTVTLESEYLKGTSVTIRLPVVTS